jgi:hypothetical protein
MGRNVAKSMALTLVEEALVMDGLRIGSGDQSLGKMELELER